MSTGRRSTRADAIANALRNLLPRAPARELVAIAEQAAASHGLRRGRPEAVAWLSAVAWIRHNLTEYDDLLAEGYDHESARHFTATAIDAVLAEWGCRLWVREE